MKLLTCSHCGQRVFFENTQCGRCGSALGFVPGGGLQMAAFTVGAESWQGLGEAGAGGPTHTPCRNYSAESVCNWMLTADDPGPYCLSCRSTRIIPALSKAENRRYWALLEQAKRRLFYTLLSLGLPTDGLSFQFLEQVDAQDQVLTGHDQGLITLNIAEADDAQREQVRSRLHEPYRTLLGHFRHESGHFYWDRLVQDQLHHEEYRQLFGDERQDYSAALEQHYAQPAADWAQRFISAYASSHPWEDWAECWAHYLHLVDGLETAAAWGLRLEQATPGGAAVVPAPVDRAASGVEGSVIEQWLPVTQFINAMNRSMGLHDPYPFVLPSPVLAKLDFIHRVVAGAAAPVSA